MRHVLAAMVTNEPGVLAQVAGMFAARGFNIDSLVVGRTENAEISRMTIVVNGDDAVLEQVRKQARWLQPHVLPDIPEKGGKTAGTGVHRSIQLIKLGSGIF